MSVPSAPLIFTRHWLPLEADRMQSAPTLTLTLTAEERAKTRHYFEARLIDQGRLEMTGPSTDRQGVYLRLPRGTVLQDGDRLTTDSEEAVLAIVAKPEPVMTVTANTPLALLKAAYHLGNRHVSLEVRETWLRFSPDPVLQHLLEQMGLTVSLDEMPFFPESGAYASSKNHHHSE